MRVVEKVCSEVKAIAMVGTGGVRGRRDGNALVCWNRRAGELTDEPAVGNLVVKDNGVAIAVVLADAAEARPDRTDGSWPKDRCASRLIEDLIA